MPISQLLTDRTTFYLEPTATIIETVNLLTQKQIQSAPILLKKDAVELDCIGFVDVLDCAMHVLDQVDAHLRDDADFKNFKNSIMYADVSSILNRSDKNPFIPTVDISPLEDVLPILSSGVHRLPIFNAVSKSFTGILSQSDFVLLLASLKSHRDLTSLMGKTVQELGYNANIITADTKTLVYDILRIMKTQNITAVPLVNEKSELMGCFSASDIRSLPLDEWSNLFQNVNTFLAERHRESLNPVSVTTNETFADVLTKMEQFRVHRVIVVDDTKKPVGIISMTDVLKWLQLLLSK